MKIKCSECGKEFEIFSDEADKKVKCPGCAVMLDPQACKTS